MAAFAGAGGRLDVGGAAQSTGNLAKLVGTLSCLDRNQIESLMSDMATLQMMAEANALYNHVQPDLARARSRGCTSVAANASWARLGARGRPPPP